MSTPNVNVTIGGISESTSTYKTVVLKSSLGFEEQLTSEDTKYVIKYDFSLGGTVERECAISSGSTALFDNPAYKKLQDKLTSLAADIAEQQAIIDNPESTEEEIYDAQEMIKVLNSDIAAVVAQMGLIPAQITYYYKEVSVPANTTIVLSSAEDEIFMSDDYGEPRDYYQTFTEAQSIRIAALSPVTVYYKEMPTVRMPLNTILEFDGGTISGGCLIGNRTLIKAADEQVLFPVHTDDTFLTGRFLNSYATLKWFGAAGDNVTEDSLPFQRTSDFGADIYIPGRSIYLIKNTIYLRTVNQNIYCEATSKTGKSNALNTPGASIVFNPDDEDVIMFKIIDKIHDIRFGALRIIGIAYKGTIVDCSTSYCDKDISFQGTLMANIGLGINFKGRGCTVRNCMFHGQKAFIGNWDDADSSTHAPAENEQRGYIFSDNRFHVMRNTAIEIQSGHASGLVFTNNLMDFGRNRIIYCKEEAWNWNISGNTAQYCWQKPNLSWMLFEGGVKNSIIANNTLSCKRDPNYFSSIYSTDITAMHTGIRIEGGCSGLQITNNTLQGVLDYGIVMTGVIDRLNLSGNIISDLGYQYIDRTRVSSVEFLWILKSSTYSDTTISNSVIEGNIVQFIEDEDLVTAPSYDRSVVHISSATSFTNVKILNNTYNIGSLLHGANFVFDDACEIQDSRMSRGLYSEKPVWTRDWNNNLVSGFRYFATDLKKTIYWGGTYWVDSDGTQLTYPRRFILSRVNVSNAQQPNVNEEGYTTTLVASDNYRIPDTITVTMGGSACAYTYDTDPDSEDYGKIVITPAITGTLYINATGVRDSWAVTYNLFNITASNTSSASMNVSYSTTLTADSGYTLPSSVTVTMGGSLLTRGTDYTYSQASGVLTILGTGGSGGVTGDVVIRARGV